MVRTIQKGPGLGLILPPTSRSINPTFCHIVRLCVYEQTMIIFLNCAISLVVIMEMRCVYRQMLFTLTLCLDGGRAMVEAFSHRYFTTEDRV